MKHTWYILAVPLISISVARGSAAQMSTARSHSSGFFVGLGAEGDGVSTHVPQSGIWTREAGGGAGLVLGYGFTTRWSLYSEVSGATIEQVGGGKYSLAHIDLGARVHFRTGSHAVVPFVQLGFSGRPMIQHFPGDSAFQGPVATESRSAGLGFGGGLNAHFNPALAFSGSVAWTVGDFENYKENGQRVGGLTWHATSARMHLRVVWFPAARTTSPAHSG